MTAVDIFIVEQIDPIQPVMGGCEAYSHNLLKFLCRQRKAVGLIGVTNDHRNTLPDVQFPCSFTFIPVANTSKISSYQYLLRLMSYVPWLPISPSTIIHAQRPDYLLPFNLFHRNTLKVVTLHGNPLESLKIQKPRIVRIIYSIVESYCLKKCDAVIAVDPRTKDYYERKYPWLESKIQVIPVGIDTTKFKLLDKDVLRRRYGFAGKDRIILYVGRLEKEKNLDFLMDCFIHVAAVIPEAKLVLVGDGRERKHLESRVQPNFRNKILFMGIQSPDKIPEIINCADVLSLSSFTEGSPTVVREALACGVRVVSVDVGDVPKIVQEETMGQIVPREGKRFSQALITVLSKEENKALRVSRSAYASRFSFDTVGEDTLRLYEELWRYRC
jgi:glycosyltransferase involved in cell wall biosynthesis